MKKETKYPGIQRIDADTFRVRVRAIDPKTGKRIERDRIVHVRTTKEALEEQVAIRAEIEQLQPRERLTLRAYAASWLRTKLPSLKASTRHHYADVLDNHVLPVLGDHFLNMITRDDLVEWRDSMQVAPATINTRMRVLKALLRAATDDEHCPRDPTRGLPALRERKKRKSVTAPELVRLLDAAKEHTPEWYPLFVVLAHTGLRFSEVSALQWGDIDEAERVVHINRAQVKGKIDLPKTDETRSVPLSDEMLHALKEHRERQRKATLKRLKRQKVANLEELLEAETSAWVFPSPRGADNRTLMHNTATRKPLLLCAEKAKVDLGFSNHWFRHTFNNVMRTVAQGVVLRSITGHDSEAMTEHYSHVSIDEKRAALGAFVKVLSASQNQKGGSKGGSIPANAEGVDPQAANPS